MIAVQIAVGHYHLQLGWLSEVGLIRLYKIPAFAIRQMPSYLFTSINQCRLRVHNKQCRLCRHHGGSVARAVITLENPKGFTGPHGHVSAPHLYTP